jgi:hypothetical protein
MTPVQNKMIEKLLAASAHGEDRLGDPGKQQRQEGQLLVLLRLQKNPPGGHLQKIQA